MPQNTAETRISMHDAYDKHSSIQKAAMEAGLKYLPTFPDRKSVTVIDYGSSQGANSIPPLKQVLSTLPQNATASLLFEDTPFNDFTTLAQTVHSALPLLSEPRPGSKVSVFPSLIPYNFYNVVLPSPTADLGLSWSSLNYLSSPPQVKIDATTSAADVATARAKASEAAGHTDLIMLLKLRAQEIRPGGYFVAGIGGRKAAGEDRETETGARPLQPAFVDMLKSGKLTMGELGAIALFPSHERTPEEIQKVLDLDEIKALWEVESLDSELIVHPAWKSYQEKNKGAKNESERAKAAEEYARATVTNITTSAGWFWVDVLKTMRGPGWDGGDEFLEETTETAIKCCAENFADIRVEIWYHYLKLKRKEDQ